MQDVEVKSPVRPRTRLERLTEKHTPQRPNWAMADADTPSVSHSITTTRPVKQLRRVPNTIFRPPPIDPSFPLLEQRRNNSAELPHEARTIRTDPLHTTVGRTGHSAIQFPCTRRLRRRREEISGTLLVRKAALLRIMAMYTLPGFVRSLMAINQS